MLKSIVIVFLLAGSTANAFQSDAFDCTCKVTCLAAGDPHIVNIYEESSLWESDQGYSLFQTNLLPNLGQLTFEVQPFGMQDFITAVNSASWSFHTENCTLGNRNSNSTIINTVDNVVSNITTTAECMRRSGAYALDLYIEYSASFPWGSSEITWQEFRNEVSYDGLCFVNATNASPALPGTWHSHPQCTCTGTAFPTEAPTSAPSYSPSTDFPTEVPTTAPFQSSVPSSAPTGGSSSSTPTEAPTSVPTTLTPTEAPTTVPTTLTPTEAPTTVPTTLTPTEAPTTVPTSLTPTEAPTTVPTTLTPTEAPTTVPTSLTPTEAPTSVPTTLTPTEAPTNAPTTSTPTEAPTSVPTTLTPTEAPTTVPTTLTPTEAPTSVPTTLTPTEAPSSVPTTLTPTEAPTSAPTTLTPTEAPTSVPTTFTPTEAPTDAPTTSTPTETPTNAPTTSTPSGSPSSLSPTETPTATPSSMTPTTSSPSVNVTLSPSTFAPTSAFFSFKCNSTCQAIADPHITTFAGDKYISKVTGPIYLFDSGSESISVKSGVHNNKAWIIRTFVNDVEVSDISECQALTHGQTGTVILDNDYDVGHVKVICTWVKGINPDYGGWRQDVYMNLNICSGLPANDPSLCNSQLQQNAATGACFNKQEVFSNIPESKMACVSEA